MTNGERLRAMTDEELAKLLCNLTRCTLCFFSDLCINNENGAYKWLKQESEEEK